MTDILLFSKSFNTGMHLVYEPVWCKLGMMIDTIELYSLILVGVILTFIGGHRCARKWKLQHQLSHQVRAGFEWNLVCCQYLWVCWTSFSFHLSLSMFKGENRELWVHVSSSPKNLCRFYVHIYPFRLVGSLKLSMVIKTIESCYILLPVWMTLTFIQGHSYIQNQILLRSFFHKVCNWVREI